VLDAGADGTDVGDARVVPVVGIGPVADVDNLDVELVFEAVGAAMLGTNWTGDDTGNVEETTSVSAMDITVFPCSNNERT
jgi:hypothetical protein